MAVCPRNLRRVSLGTLVAVGLLVVVARPAHTQTAPASQAPGKWRVEVYGGSLFGSTNPSGSAREPLPVGETFTTAGGFPSRRVSSWYFGDGADLFREVADDFARRFGQQVTRIRPLDAVLTGTAASRGGGGGFGVRITRVLSPRFAVEIGLERSTRPLRLTDDASSAVEAARASFETGFTSLINTLPQSGLLVTSTADIVEPPAGSTTISGALVVSLLERGRWHVEAVAGAGGVFGGGGKLEVRLRGAYQFQIFGVLPISESDLVTFRITDRGQAAVGVFGGGVTYALTERHAVRFNFRMLAGQSDLTTTVSASPTRSNVLPPVFLPSRTDPSIQFSNTSGARTSLSGEPLMDLRTFESSGLDLRGQLTVGFVVKF